jgi:hypothetical protein
MRQPTYYRPDFSAAEMTMIAEITGPTAARFGYEG